MGETLSEAIGADHHLFDVYYENLINAPDDGAKVRWRNQLTWLVARHAVSEELTWYPAMEKHMGEEGRKLAMTDKEQHNGVKAVLFKLQDTSPTTNGFQELLDELMGNLHHHAEHEKNEDMPKFEALLSREESEAYARQFQRTKAIVPTRGHPGLPTSYMFENIAALLAAPLDRFADLTRDFPDEQDQNEAQRAADDNKSAGRETVGGKADLISDGPNISQMLLWASQTASLSVVSQACAATTDINDNVEAIEAARTVATTTERAIAAHGLCDAAITAAEWTPLALATPPVAVIFGAAVLAGTAYFVADTVVKYCNIFPSCTFILYEVRDASTRPQICEQYLDFTRYLTEGNFLGGAFNGAELATRTTLDKALEAA